MEWTDSTQTLPGLYDFLQGDRLAVVAFVVALFIMTDALPGEGQCAESTPLLRLITGPTDEPRAS